MDLTEEPGCDSGCTAVVAVLRKKDLYVANAGDSRCVLCRDGEALELSLDHKPEDEPEMSRIVKAGGKVTLDGRVNGGLNLSRALGDHAYKRNSALPPQEQMISALPDIRHISLEPGRDEFMILACDGIWNFMSSQEVIKFIRPRLAENSEKSNISKICEDVSVLFYLYFLCFRLEYVNIRIRFRKFKVLFFDFNPLRSSRVHRTPNRRKFWSNVNFMSMCLDQESAVA